MRFAIPASAGVLAGLLACLTGVRADEQEVPLKDLPRAVLDAVRQRFPGAKLTEASKETEDGKTVYEVALKHQGRKIDTSLTAEGKITEIETEVATGDLPPAVLTAVRDKYPGSTITKAEEVVAIKEGKEIKNYEVLVKTGDRRKEVKVSPAGKVLEDEDDEEED